jgi:hypothetical protein
VSEFLLMRVAKPLDQRVLALNRKTFLTHRRERERSRWPQSSYSGSRIGMCSAARKSRWSNYLTVSCRATVDSIARRACLTQSPSIV